MYDIAWDFYSVFDCCDECSSNTQFFDFIQQKVSVTRNRWVIYLSQTTN